MDEAAFVKLLKIYFFGYQLFKIRYSDWEIEHEFDSPLLSENEIWTTANLGEVLPGTITPLTRYGY